MIDSTQKTLISGKNFFDKQCDLAANFLDTHPTSYKIALIANHIFRSATIFTMAQSLPFSLPISCGIILLSSLLYRISVERFCTFRFTMPSLAGALSIWAGRSAVISLASQTAFSSVGACFSTGLGILSLSAYFIFICNLSNEDIKRRMKTLQASCCCQ